MRTLAVVALALLLTGCTPPDYSTKVFDSTQALSDVIKPAGWKCVADDVATTERGLSANGFRSAPCNDGALTVWATSGKRDEVLSKSWNSRTGWCRISRSNWTIDGKEDLVRAAQKIVGGEVTCT